MRLTSKIFNDLAIFMVILGVIVGLVFPFLSLLLGVPEDVAIQPTYFIACIIAGVVLALMNITIAKLVIRSPLQQLSTKMRHVQKTLVNNKNEVSGEVCSTEDCLIVVESKDELGECADAFNGLVETLFELIRLKNEIYEFSGMLASHIELESFAEETLKRLSKSLGAIGGVILIANNGELEVATSMAVKNAKKLENDERILKSSRTFQRQVIECINDTSIETNIESLTPKYLLIEPITYKSALLGVVVLINESMFTKDTMNKLSIFSNDLTLAFRNTITHNQMQKLAAIDDLTNIYNRRFGTIRLQEEFERSKRGKMPISILMFDIDYFKNVNDEYGHLIGDRVLMNLTKIVSGAIRLSDILLRYGGEEFLCVLLGTSQNDAKNIAEKIRTLVMNSTVRIDDLEIKITISVGITSFPHPEINTYEQFISFADKAMYIAKDSGRNRVEII